MLNQFLPTKRLPLGIVELGRCFKKYTFEPYVQQNDDLVYEDTFYRDIGADIQFKRVQNKDAQAEQPMQRYLTDSTCSLIETTDSYFNSDFKRYCCCINEGDIVMYQNELWLVTSVKEKTIFNPSPQNFYYLNIKKLCLKIRSNNDSN